MEKDTEEKEKDSARGGTLEIRVGPMDMGYNGQNAAVLVTPSRPRHAVGGRAPLPKNYPIRPIPSLTEQQRAELWSRVAVDMRDSDACWPWLGVFSRISGYGRWRSLYAHRVAYTDIRGEIPNGMTIDHTCRNRACMNPSHMEAVTISENVKRRALGPSIGPSVGSRKRTAERFHRRRERGVCVQCNTSSVKYRCDRCREIHNARNKGRKR